jgi:hypothetical protein
MPPSSPSAGTAGAMGGLAGRSAVGRRTRHSTPGGWTSTRGAPIRGGYPACRWGCHPGRRGYPSRGPGSHSGGWRGTEAAGNIPGGAVEDPSIALWHPRGDKTTRTSCADAAERPALKPRCRVNAIDPVGSDITEMVRDEHRPPIYDDRPVEVMENIKSRKLES